MQGAGEDVLAAAGFAGDEHGDIGRRHLPGDPNEIGHRRRGVDDAELLFRRLVRPGGGTVALVLPQAHQRDGRLD